jgi:hypothetical protein
VTESIGTATSAASTKALRATFLQEKIDVVCRGCHELLLAIAPASLGSLDDEKAFYQKAVVNMFQEVFDKAEMGLARRVEEAQVTADVADREQEARNGARATAELELQQKKIEIDEKNELLAKETAILQETDTSLQVALERKNGAHSQYNALTAEQESILAAQKESLEVLKAGTWASAREYKKHTGILSALFKKLGADASLISAMPSALEKKPADRGTFDGMVVGQLEEILATHVVAKQKEMAVATATVQHASSDADAAIALAEAAREKHKNASEVALQAQAEWKVVEAKLRHAIWAAKEQQRALKQAGLDLLDEHSGLERIRGAKLTLNALGGGCVESSDAQSISEDPNRVKADSKTHSFSPSTREKGVAFAASASRDRTVVSPDDRKVASRTGMRSGSQPVSPGSRPETPPESCPGSRSVSPGQAALS